MKLKSQTSGIIGKVDIVVTDGLTGKIKQTLTIPNLVVTTGKTYIASRMVGTSSTVMSHMAIGTGSTSPAGGDTTLATEAGRVALTAFTNSGAVATATATFPAGTGTGAIVEAGIFNASSAGTLLCRTTFPVVNKAAGDSFSVTWTITVS